MARLEEAADKDSYTKDGVLHLFHDPMIDDML